MKSISDFVRGKYLRMEVDGDLSIETAGEAHPRLGPFECTLASSRGRMTFFDSGFLLEDGSEIAYGSIERIMSGPPSAQGGCDVDLHLAGGLAKRVRSSAAGAEMVYATLRWIGHTRLRRRIAE